MDWRKFWGMLVIFSLVVFSFAEGGYAQNPGFDEKEIRIGQWGPQTGPAAPWGAVARGTKLYFDMINEEGGIHGRTIRYFIRDDQYNPSQTMAAVRDLVDRQGIFAVVGGVGTACGVAVQDYLKQRQIIWVGVTSGAREFHDNPWLWNIWPAYFDEGSLLAKYAVEKKGLKKIAVIYQNDDWGLDTLEGVKARLQKHKIDLLAAIPVEPVERDLSSQIARLKATGAEAVIAVLAPTQAAISLRTAVSVGFRPQWLFSYNLSDYALMNHITDGLWGREGVITGAFTENPFSDHPLVKKYREAAARLTPQERWGLNYMGGFVVAEPFVVALKNVGRNLSKEAVVKALDSTTNFKGVGPGPITWRQGNHLPPKQIQIWQCGPKGEVIVLQSWQANEISRK